MSKILILLMSLSFLIMIGCQSNSYSDDPYFGDINAENTENFLTDANELANDYNDVNSIDNSPGISDNNSPPDIQPVQPNGPAYNSPKGKKEINNYINNMNSNIEKQFNNECKNQ